MHIIYRFLALVLAVLKYTQMEIFEVDEKLDRLNLFKVRAEKKCSLMKNWFSASIGEANVTENARVFIALV